MAVKIIVAYDKNKVIGNDGGIPWKIIEDMKHFKKTTMGETVIMGRKTWDSLPDRFKPLPGRTNIVLSRNENLSDDGCTFCSDIESALRLVSFGEIYIIGGAEIYRLAIGEGWVDEIIASEVKGEYQGDAFFPELSSHWKSKIIKEFDDFNIVSYHF